MLQVKIIGVTQIKRSETIKSIIRLVYYCYPLGKRVPNLFANLRFCVSVSRFYQMIC